VNRQDLLDQIEADIIAKNICPDLAKTAKRLVFGSGNIDADIVFIGEAPGKKEDETGEPFVGAAGKFLDTMLATIHTNRSDIYITNIVKYRPPNNRDPLLKEKQAFLPYLMRQLEVIDPTVIVTLGRHSMEAFLPSAIIGQNHGQAQQICTTIDGVAYNWTVLPLYHPAAALYNGGLRQTLYDDFATIPNIINKIHKLDKSLPK